MAKSEHAEKKPKEEEINDMEARRDARMRGLGSGTLYSSQDAGSQDELASDILERGLTNDTTVRSGRTPNGTPKNRMVSELSQENGGATPRTHKASATLTPLAAGTPPRRLSPNLRPEHGSPVVKCAAAAALYRGEFDDGSSRPNSAVGTPGTDRPGRVGFSKQRKSDRKAFLGSTELLYPSARNSPVTPRSERISASASATFPRPTSAIASSSHSSPRSAHIVVSNPVAQDDDATSDISLSLSMPTDQEASPEQARKEVKTSQRSMRKESDLSSAVPGKRISTLSSDQPDDGDVTTGEPPLTVQEDSTLGLGVPSTSVVVSPSASGENGVGSPGDVSQHMYETIHDADRLAEHGAVQKRPSELSLFE